MAAHPPREQQINRYGKRTGGSTPANRHDFWPYESARLIGTDPARERSSGEPELRRRLDQMPIGPFDWPPSKKRAINLEISTRPSIRVSGGCHPTLTAPRDCDRHSEQRHQLVLTNGVKCNRSVEIDGHFDRVHISLR